MHCPRMHWHPAPCTPWYAWGGCGGHGWHGHHGVSWQHAGMAPANPYVMAPPSPCGSRWPVTLTQEIAVEPTSSPQIGLVGGQTDAHLTLEYYVESGAASPAVTVTIESGGSTSTWNDSGIAAGYHTKEDFASLPPGARVTLEATDAAARLRWCETICC